MLKMAVQQGRSEQRGESYSVPYVEPLSDARTPLADFFSILLSNPAPSNMRSEIALLDARLYELAERFKAEEDSMSEGDVRDT
jgi:hypothetical protein